MADHSFDTAAELQAEFRELGALSGAGFSGNDDHLVISDGVQQLLAAFDDGQLGRVGELLWSGRPSLRQPLMSGIDLPGDRVQNLRTPIGVRNSLDSGQPPPEPLPVVRCQSVKAATKVR